MEIIVNKNELPEEYENVIRDLLLKSFGITIIPPFDYCFTALQDDKILGFCATVERNIIITNTPHVLFLLGLFTVAEKHRKKGYGSARLQYAVSQLKDDNCEGIILNCGKNKVSFYTANGFEVISEKARYSRNGHIEEDNDPVLLYLYSEEGIKDFYADSVFLGTDF